MSDVDIQSILQSKDGFTVTLSKFPCHTQGTERCIRLVTEASAAVFGEEQRHGFIFARLESRKLMKTFNTKAEFRMP